MTVYRTHSYTDDPGQLCNQLYINQIPVLLVVWYLVAFLSVLLEETLRKYIALHYEYVS